LVYRHGMRTAGGRRSMIAVEHADLDGYALVQKALGQAPLAEIEFAASLMTERAVAAAHRHSAELGASQDPYLRRNLAAFATD